MTDKVVITKYDKKEKKYFFKQTTAASVNDKAIVDEVGALSKDDDIIYLIARVGKLVRKEGVRAKDGWLAYDDATFTFEKDLYLKLRKKKDGERYVELRTPHYRCEWCDFIGTAEITAEHVESEHPESCDHCKFRGTSEELEKHVESEHPEPEEEEPPDPEPVPEVEAK